MPGDARVAEDDPQDVGRDHAVRAVMSIPISVATPADSERIDTAVAQRDVQRRPLDADIVV